MKHDKATDRLLALLNLAFLVLLFGLTIWYQTGRERVPGVFTHQIGPCDVAWFGERSVLVVACPGQDLIRVWPLPVEQPWWEDESGLIAVLTPSALRGRECLGFF